MSVKRTATMRAKPERIASGFYFLEGPRWRDGWLWVSDMIGRTVHKVSLEGQVERVVDVPGRPSGLGFFSDGSLLLVSMRERRLYKHRNRSEEHTSELQSLMRNSYAVFCLKKKKKRQKHHNY